MWPKPVASGLDGDGEKGWELKTERGHQYAARESSIFSLFENMEQNVLSRVGFFSPALLIAALLLKKKKVKIAENCSAYIKTLKFPAF